ncbi:hypothetical protein TruAng_003270 [Truncatella angustata]|nr:hypothetical protein TruAng_003270 [Truncatella angustata]
MASGHRYNEEDEDEDEDEESPLHSQRTFGAGLYRKPIAFLPAQAAGLTTASEKPASSPSAADLYLGIVFSQTEESEATTSHSVPPRICEVCELPIGDEGVGTSAKPHARRHEATLAHQVCLPHSHPPSALDRSRMGLSVLQSQGWDPDSRKGLGSAQQGLQHPIKAREKRGKLGVGVEVPKNLEVYRKEKPQKLDAGKVRKMAAEDKKRREKLHRQFYGNVDLEKYLGGG